jgi:hypothetical protein
MKTWKMASAVLAACMIVSLLCTPGASERAGIFLEKLEREERFHILVGEAGPGLPRLEVIRGGNPRIVLDIPGVREWGEGYRIETSSRYVRSVRSYLHLAESRLRVVLDMVDDPSYYFISHTYEIAGQGREVIVSLIRRGPGEKI